MNYIDVLRASDTPWQTDAIKLMENGHEFVVINISEGQYRDCIALAQEHDYTCIIEDKETKKLLIAGTESDIFPKQLGFVHRNKFSQKKS